MIFPSPNANTIKDLKFLYLSALPDELGYDVQPATNTNFGVSEVIKSRLPSPYTSKCQSNWTQTNYTEFLGRREEEGRGLQ